LNIVAIARLRIEDAADLIDDLEQSAQERLMTWPEMLPASAVAYLTIPAEAAHRFRGYPD
jgi:hypothetical protein